MMRFKKGFLAILAFIRLEFATTRPVLNGTSLCMIMSHIHIHGQQVKLQKKVGLLGFKNGYSLTKIARVQMTSHLAQSYHLQAAMMNSLTAMMGNVYQWKINVMGEHIAETEATRLDAKFLLHLHPIAKI